MIGSGFGGALAARELVDAGMRVMMLERGDWVARGEHNRDMTAPWKDRDGYCLETPYELEGDTRKRIGAFHCVGGPSVFYGGVALRMREDDFAAHPEISGDLHWPIGYGELDAHYDTAERLLGVTGELTGDATSPPRRRSLPLPHLELSDSSRTLWDAARRLGLNPFRLPLAINSHDNGRPRCTACGVCDGFACAIGAKNDLASTLLPRLVARGLVLRPNTVAVSLETVRGRVERVICVDRVTGKPLSFSAERFVVAAGALATPHLLLSSGLERVNPAGDEIGRNLMRHCNGIVLAGSGAPAGGGGEFRKQLGVHDFYLGDPASDVSGRLGAIQQISAPPIALAMAPLPPSVKLALNPVADRIVGFIVIAEDQPDRENRVYLDPHYKDRFGRPVARIRHRHTPRDVAARKALYRRAEEILKEAGCAFTFRVPIGTFSHGLGTVRMGEDPTRFPLTSEGRLRGTENVWITDGSVFPTSGAVNPSLSIAANALRIAARIVADEVSDASSTTTRARAHV